MSEETGSNARSLYTGKRPPSLSMLCILSFIGSGASALSAVVVLLTFDLLPEYATLSPLPGAKEMVDLVIQQGRLFFVLMGIWYAISFVGVLFMWKLRKPGFHLYTVAQLFMLLTPLMLFQNFQLPITNFLLTGSFVLAYGLNMRFMR